MSIIILKDQARDYIQSGTVLERSYSGYKERIGVISDIYIKEWSDGSKHEIIDCLRDGSISDYYISDLFNGVIRILNCDIMEKFDGSEFEI